MAVKISPILLSTLKAEVANLLPTLKNTISIETGRELSPELFIDIKNVGVTAGASTPAFIIQEVLNNMSDMNRDLEMDFGAMLAEFEGSEVKLHRNPGELSHSLSGFVQS